MRIPHEDKDTLGQGLIPLSNEIAAAILLTLKAGWKIATKNSGLNASAGEVEITERLRDGMRIALNDNMFQWSRAMTVLPGTESRSRPQVLTPDGRTDIPIFIIEIFAQYGVHDPHAIIECKRIAGSDSKLCRLYVVEGIDRFQTGKYARNHRVGFMVGYLLSGDAAAAVSSINQYLTRKGRKAELLEPSDIVNESRVWGSRHIRKNLSYPIRLNHAFFKLKSATTQT